jgi:ABC-type multidrug transport system ATPase subunit
LNIRLNQAGKKYFNQWIFRKLNLDLGEGTALAVLGANGSGKSTLLQVMAGASLLNEGSVAHLQNETVTNADDVFRFVSIAAPYLELVEEFTLEESANLHFRFKKTWGQLTVNDVIEHSGLSHARNKPVRFFSSGMKQRLKLTLACLSDTPLLLLDEPCSNLDQAGINWYSELVKQCRNDRTVVVCSNSHQEEYFFCTEKIVLEDYKR